MSLGLTGWMMAASLASAAAAAPADVQEITAAGVVFRWHVEGEELVAEVSAQTTGWVLAGLNDVPTLAGSRLVFGVVDADGRAHAEEHRADPPAHHRVAVLPDADVRGQRSADGGTAVAFRLPLERAGQVSLQAGQTVYLTLAWSRSADLSHHSAAREQVLIQL